MLGQAEYGPKKTETMKSVIVEKAGTKAHVYLKSQENKRDGR